MALGLLGYKRGMSQVFNPDGTCEPVTVLEVGPCPVLQIREKGRDGYTAVQLGFKDKPRKNANRPEQGHVAASLKSRPEGGPPEGRRANPAQGRLRAAAARPRVPRGQPRPQGRRRAQGEPTCSTRT